MVEEKIESFLKNKKFTLTGKRLLVGVSGGPDSLALLNYLWEKQSQHHFYFVVAHVDHMFRGTESFNEAKFVEQYCEDRKIPFRMTRINVPEYMKKTGKSSQVSSRECRYQFFAEVMEEHQLTYVALAHHGDDQIETVLMRLTRGSSGSSRAGIPFIRPFNNGFIFRPFLCLSRKEIEQYCIEHELEPRHDPSNEKDDYLRNRYRKYVVPFLKRENSHVHEHFQRFSEDLQEDELLLRELTIQKMKTVWKEKKHSKITIDIDAFQVIPMPLQRRGIKLILDYLYKKRPASLSAIHIDHFFSLIESSHPSGRLDFPSGLKVIRSYQKCHFLFHSENKEGFRFELSEPGDCILPNGDSINLRFTDSDLQENSLYSILLNKEDVSLPVIIRTRQPGDRMSLKGMEGTKKVKNIFIDEKIPVGERENWPVVTDIHNRIIWLPGLKKYHEADAVHQDKDYILLTYRRKN
ncbi:tRNA lysidine(34) synthetase TilS [Bacillus sp. V3B]|uniref:tRNA lysidine(34) synthetase TilS n=1 Tax=Bacillus sp. V3B TaxID=2804915 RepID=UPI00210A45B0|nr:tRNA lysidine(34) synthetase TilS [Bacillus sp. V3B]MCQ6276734.1 tRNA lysidine(34) synthetase TilS [Bacillus sp. V3B]